MTDCCAIKATELKTAAAVVLVGLSMPGANQRTPTLTELHTGIFLGSSTYHTYTQLLVTFSGSSPISLGMKPSTMRSSRVAS